MMQTHNMLLRTKEEEEEEESYYELVVHIVKCIFILYWIV